MTGPWRMLRTHRALSAALGLAVAALAIAAVAQEQGPDIPEGLRPTAIRDSTCWPCHVGDTPPLRDPFIVIDPPATTGAPVGKDFNWTVTFRMAWNPKPLEPHLLFVNPSLDLTAAPSLRFGGAHPPVDDTYQRSIPIDPRKLQDRQQNVTRVLVDPGVTSLTWTVTPKDPRADLVLLVSAPGGNGTIEVDDQGPGAAETRQFAADELAQLGSGNWTVGAAVRPLPQGTDPSSGLHLTRVDFTLQHKAEYDTASLRVLSAPQNVFIPGGGLHLQNWVLNFAQAPGDGESVKVAFDTVTWYRHDPPVGSDFGLIRTEKVFELGSQPAIVHEPSDTVVERPKPANGPTVTRVSEAIGYASAFLLISSIVSGGMFGQGSRRAMNRIFESAKRRVAYHNFLSYGLTVAALAHIVLFFVPLLPPSDGQECNEIVGLCRPTEEFRWTTGILWFGGPAMLAMLGLGLTGALQVPMIRRWSYPMWKWWHYGLTVATIVFTLLHMLIDGQNFAAQIPEDIHAALKDPFHEEPAVV